MKKRLFLIALIILAIAHRVSAQWQSVGLTSGAGALAFASNGALYAGTTHGVYRRNPETLVWEARGLGERGVGALVADPRSAGILYAVGGDAPGLPGGVFKTTDGGLTWTPTITGLDLITNLVIDPMEPATLYAATELGLYKSTDAAGHWTPINAGLTSRTAWTIAIDPRNTSTVYVGTDDGVFKSADGGLSWRPMNVGLRPAPYPYTAAAFAIDPTNTSTIYLASWANIAVPFEMYPGNGVYKSTNGGETWAPIYGAGFPGAMSAVVIDPRSAATVYAAIAWRGGVVRTTDGGASWTDISAGLPYPAYALAVDPTTAGTVYATTRGGVFQLTTGNGSGCTANSDTLCLNTGRFKVRVAWRVPSQGTSGTGQAVLMTSDTGSFWFISSNNVELVVKVVDGRAFNNKFWVFYGALTNVEYTITVTDTQTGAVKTYFNPQGQLASVADTAAF